MDPSKEFCHNQDCAARGQVGKGNIIVHNRKEKRCKCTACNMTFTETKGTAFYRLRKNAQFVEIVIRLLSCGCPIQAIVFAFGWHERTVMNLERRAGQKGEAAQKHIVEKPHDLGQVAAPHLIVEVSSSTSFPHVLSGNPRASGKELLLFISVLPFWIPA